MIHLSLGEFPGKILVQESKTAKDEAQKDRSGLALWLDGSKLESRGAGAAVVWKNPASLMRETSGYIIDNQQTT